MKKMLVDVVRVSASNALSSHQFFLRAALELAQQGRGFSAPNPAVGAVLVRDNVIISSGFHRGSGLPHAEVEALQGIENTQDSTLYVTLEPCCHWGKTPPCTDLLITKEIKQVYYSFLDPNPKIQGKTKNILAAANILCEQIKLPEIDKFYQSYVHWHKHQRPFVTYKLALSLDGKIAGTQGTPIKLTHSLTDQFTQQQRKASDAILTTSTTIDQDDPQLNVRLHDTIIAKPLYVLDKTLALRLHSRIFTTAKTITIFHGKHCDKNKLQQLAEKNVRCIEIPVTEHLSLAAVLNWIGQDGVHDLWIEAGGILLNAMLTQQLINQLYFYITPQTLGPNATPGFLSTHSFTAAQEISWKKKGCDAICKIEF